MRRSVLLVFLFAFNFGCKPQGSESTSISTNMVSDSEKKISAFIVEERMRQIDAAKANIGDIQRRLDFLYSDKLENLSESQISIRIGKGDFGFTDRTGAYDSARANYFVRRANEIEVQEKALAEAQKHLRILLGLTETAVK